MLQKNGWQPESIAGGLMTIQPSFPCIGVIADDLPGAVVAGSRLAESGLRTMVVSHPDWPLSPEALVVDVGTRLFAADDRPTVSTIPMLVGSAARRLRTQLRCPRIELRVDAALRRDYSADVEAVLLQGARHADPIAVAVPAFPSAGRWTTGGLQVAVVAGSTELEVNVESQIFRGRSSSVVPLGVVRRGPQAVASRIRDELASCRCFVVDAESEDDLRVAAEAVAVLESRLEVITISSGAWLAYHPAAVHRAGFVLVAMGLPTEPNELQLEELLRCTHSRLMLVEEALGYATAPQEFARSARAIDVLIVKARGSIESDRDRLVAAQNVAVAVETLLVASQRSGVKCHGVLGTGAFTAARLAAALGATAIIPTVVGDSFSPIGIISTGPWAGLRVVMKGGLVGGRRALVELVEGLGAQRNGGAATIDSD